MHERMGVMYLSSALKPQGHEIRLVLAEAVGLERLKELVRDFAPRVIGYSAMTGEYKGLFEVNRALKKEFDYLAVFGGPHPTFFPQIINDEGVDAICVGEGDLSFPEFCRRVDAGEDYWNTPSFLVNHQGKTYRNPLMHLVEDLDSLPWPDREIMYDADPKLVEEGHKLFFSSRGCPYRCAYCFNEKYNEIYKGKGKIMRFRTPENLIREMESVKHRYPLSIVFFDDDVFSLKPKGYYEEFARLYKQRVGLPISCNVRANNVREDVIAILRDAGLDSVAMGIECGNEQVANSILKRDLSNDQLLRACRILQKYKIKIVTANLIGLPVPNPYEVDLETLDFNISIRPTFAWSSIMFPYPGTPIESYSLTHGYISGQPEFLETNKRSSVLKFSSEEEKRKIENLHKLFGLVVEFPVLRPYVDFLCGLRLKSFYTALFYMWYGYCYKFKIWPFESVPRELGKYVVYWIKLLKKS
jgi:radical SAM superfamily enzyme YgiQ (UPF0313 family)